MITRRDVSLELFDHIAATAYLAITGMILSMLIAIPMGNLAALNGIPISKIKSKSWRLSIFRYWSSGSRSW